MSLEKTANELRNYVKEAQKAKYIIPALAAASLYALAPRDSDHRINRLTDGFNLGIGKVKDALGVMRTTGKTMYNAGTMNPDNMSLLDQLKIYASVYGTVGKDALRQGRIGLRDFRAQLRDNVGVPTGVGNTMDKGVDIIAALFGK